jgi:glycosyltransferase involved in cell wall biosynthesis
VAPDPIVVAIVASWYPSVADPVAGRFVADQAAALAATGRAAPVVVSFDPAALSGSQPQRAALAALVSGQAREAIRRRPHVFSASGVSGPPGVPVARLPVPQGRTAAEPVLSALHAREAVLDELAERWTAGPAAHGGLPPRPALIHAHTGYPDGAAAVRLADRLGVPLVITEHASFLARLLAEPAVRAAYVAAARRAAAFVAVSERLAGELREALPEVADRITVVPNAVEVEAFAIPSDASRRQHELLFVGHRSEAKGMPTLLEALALARRDVPDATLRLIGQPPHAALDDRWRGLVAKLHLDGAVSLEPPADRAGVAAAMARAGLFVHPSRRETFGIVAAEALASGLPVVATDSGGVTEILAPDPAVLGALVPAGDPVALAAAIVDALQRRARFDPQRLRRHVMERYGTDVVVERLIRLYAAALGASGREPAEARPGADAATSPTATSTGNGAPAILVALDPERARLAIALPPAARARLVVVTAGASPDSDGRGFGGSVTVRLAGLTRTTADAATLASAPAGRSRLRMALRHPVAVGRRRGVVPGTPRLVRALGGAGLRRAIAKARALSGTDPATPPVMVCADGFDHLAAADAVADGSAVVAPGGIRWLADQVS